MNILFRKAKKTDLKGIIELCNECFEENTDLKYALKVWKKTNKDPNNIYIVGVCDNKIIAHAKITIIKTIYKDMGTYSILNHICVKPEYRRKGIAKNMLKVIEKISIKNGCKKMELWSKNFRKAAHECYKNYGFVIEEAGFFSKEIGE